MWTEQFAFMSSMTDVVPAVFTRTLCVTNVITLPAPACLLWMALVIYRGEPKAISHLYVCVFVCGCVVGEVFICLCVCLWLHGRQNSKISHIITEKKKLNAVLGVYTITQTNTCGHNVGNHQYVQCSMTATKAT